MTQDFNPSAKKPDEPSEASSPSDVTAAYGVDPEAIENDPNDPSYGDCDDDGDAARSPRTYASHGERVPPPPRRSEYPSPPPFKARPRDKHPLVDDIPKPSSSNKRFDYSQQDIQALRTALNEKKLFSLAFYFLDYILRAQTALFEQIHRQQELPRMIASMVVLCGILSGIYGMTMGMNHSIWQVLSAAVKLPILFTITAVICIPSLYTFNVLLGQRFRFLQTAALMVMTLGTTTILLASLSPIAFFFALTSPNYQFLLLMHVVIFGLCGVYGVQYLYRGCAYLAFRMEQPLNDLLLRIWIVIYALVGMQLGWRLRPFVGSTGSPFALFREEQDGNFYLAVWTALNHLLNGR